MSEPPKDRRVELLIYGTAAAFAIAAAIVAIGGRATERTPQGRDLQHERQQAAHLHDAGAIAEVPDEPARPVDDFVPDLPEVPDLEREPPPPPPDSIDPRMSQLGAEMRLLGRAREELAEHPSEALALLDQHRHLHPDGVLREEREAFAIEALIALERVEEAERRYYDFQRDYPESDFRARLRELMQRPPHEVGEHGR